MPLGIGGSIFIGVVSGVIASMCYALFMLLIRPKVRISNRICIENAGGPNAIYRIKVVNCTFAMLSDIKYVLEYCKVHEDGIKTVTQIPPLKQPLISINRFSFRKNHTDYAVRLSFAIDPLEYPLDGKNKYVFTFIARHSFSNTTTCVEKEYYAKDIIEGVFETKASTAVVVSHR